jgi:hypothetical protein
MGRTTLAIRETETVDTDGVSNVAFTRQQVFAMGMTVIFSMLDGEGMLGQPLHTLLHRFMEAF